VVGRIPRNIHPLPCVECGLRGPHKCRHAVPAPFRQWRKATDSRRSQYRQTHLRRAPVGDFCIFTPNLAGEKAASGAVWAMRRPSAPSLLGENRSSLKPLAGPTARPNHYWDFSRTFPVRDHMNAQSHPSNVQPSKMFTAPIARALRCPRPIAITSGKKYSAKSTIKNAMPSIISPLD